MPSTSEHNAIRKDYPELYPLIIATVGVIIGITLGYYFFGRADTIFDGNLLSFATNLWTEGVSIGVTVLILDRLNRRRTKEERKLELFRKTKSRSNDAAIEAVDQIRHEGFWDELKDTLRDKDNRFDFRDIRWSDVVLEEANLENANLINAKLQGSVLKKSNLGNSNLINSNLSKSNLIGANLEGADAKRANINNSNLWSVNAKKSNFQKANLSQSNISYADFSDCDLTLISLAKANLEMSNFTSADLRKADLSSATLLGANFEDANLQDANLYQTTYMQTVTFSPSTILPDAVYIGRTDEGFPSYNKYWTPETDMTRYTDPNHPDFWEPEWVKQQREKDSN